MKPEHIHVCTLDVDEEQNFSQLFATFNTHVSWTSKLRL